MINRKYTKNQVSILSEKLPKKRVCVTLTRPYLDAMERLIREDIYASRAELIRDALRRLFSHYEIEIVGAE